MKLYIVEYQELDFDGKPVWNDGVWGWLGIAESKEEAKELIEKDKEEVLDREYRIIVKEAE